MHIGVFGDIVFEVSDRIVRTFSEFQRTTSGRWATHEVMGSAPVGEFIAPGLDEITLPIQLNALLLDGTPIEDEVDTIRELIKRGAVAQLVIADRVLGKFYIESASETARHFGGKGEALVVELSLSLKEYVERTV